jgi:SOS-response transcriptional repressor LexA/DNA-binding Xre family transcriptional regulator
MPSNRRALDICERLRAALTAKGLKQSWLAQEAGITQATLSNILTGRVPNPSLGVIVAIADALGEPLGALLGERSDVLLESEQEVLRQAVEILERRLLRSRVDATREATAEAEALLRHEIPSAIFRRGARTAYRAIGESMAEEGIRDGDILYVRPTADVRTANGRIIVARIEGALVVRKLVATGRGIRLQAGGRSLNIPDPTTFEILGIVVAHLGDL